MSSRKVLLATACAMAMSAASLAAKEVTLELVVVPLQEAVEQFAEASGCQIQTQFYGRWRDKMVDLKFDHTPFWQALDKLCAAGELNYNVYNQNALRLYPGRRYSGPVVYSGPCRFEVTGANRGLYFGSPQGPRTQFSVSLRVLWEPDWSIMGVDYQVRPTVALKDDGESLLVEQRPNQNRRRHFNGVSGRCEQGIGIQLKAPKQAGGVLKTLEGSVCFAVASREEEGAIENVLQADGKEIVSGQLKVTLGTARVMGETCVVRVRAEYPEPRQQRVYLDRRVRFKLLDTDGHALQARSTSIRGSRGSRDYTMQFRTKGGKPGKLQFSWPAEYEEQEVPFKFENLPLP